MNILYSHGPDRGRYNSALRPKPLAKSLYGDNLTTIRTGVQSRGSDLKRWIGNHFPTNKGIAEVRTRTVAPANEIRFAVISLPNNF